MTETDAEVPDENGLTRAQRGVWQMHYTATAANMQLAIMSAPNPDEARRRIKLLRLELRQIEESVMNADREATATVVAMMGGARGKV